MSSTPFDHSIADAEHHLDLPVSVLMPVCNEAAVIEAVLAEWHREVFVRLPAGSELLLDEAASNDGTREILERLRQVYPYLRVTYTPRKDGFGVAARRLYLSARCPWVFFTDSDGQYVPAEFWKLARFTGTFDVIHGAKIGRQDPFLRRLASFSFNTIAHVIFDTHYTDINSAFRLMRREQVVPIVERCRHMPTLLNAELLLRCEFEGLTICQCRVRHRARSDGASRGLPPLSFPGECLRAYRGLRALRTEYLS
jgi:glycosyltransferase involved in cell wall biosynthesis